MAIAQFYREKKYKNVQQVGLSRHFDGEESPDNIERHTVEKQAVAILQKGRRK